jgi:mannan endo-1,4-beta-mannosidase
MLVAWSPVDSGPNSSSDGRGTSSTYYEGYPGDDLVDIFGVDIYHTLDESEDVETARRRLDWIAEEARTHGKAFAITETGALGESVERRAWYTDNLGRALSGTAGERVSYIMAWRNNRRTGNDREDCFPEGSTSASDRARLADFETFRRARRVRLSDAVSPGGLYRTPEVARRDSCSQ